MLEKPAHFAPGTHLDRWLFRIAQRLWLIELLASSVRKAGRLVPVEEIDIPADIGDTETAIFGRQIFAQVLRLPEAQRETVLLVYIEGFSYREAADLLDVPIGTVMSRLAAARKKLATPPASETGERHGRVTDAN